MSLRSLAILFAFLTLLLFHALPVLAHCGKCGMGEEKASRQPEQAKDKPCGCSLQQKPVKHDRAHCPGHEDGHLHGKFKCADCEKAGHQGHHGMQDPGPDGGKLDELFEKEKS